MKTLFLFLSALFLSFQAHAQSVSQNHRATYLQLSPPSVSDPTTLDGTLYIYDQLDDVVLRGIKLENGGIGNAGTAIDFFNAGSHKVRIGNRGSNFIVQTGSGAPTDQLTISTAGVFTMGSLTGFLSGASGVISAVVAKDTISKASLFTGATAIDTLFMFRVDQSGLTARSIYVKRKGGTSASVNVIRIRSGTTSALRSANLATADAVSFLTAMESFGSLQNTTSLIGDEYYLVITAIVGTVTDLTCQIVFDKAQL